jgi:hypothetical protein
MPNYETIQSDEYSPKDETGEDEDGFDLEKFRLLPDENDSDKI